MISLWRFSSSGTTVPCPGRTWATPEGQRRAAGTSMPSQTARQTRTVDSPSASAWAAVRLPSSENTCSSTSDSAWGPNCARIRSQKSVNRIEPVSPTGRSRLPADELGEAVQRVLPEAVQPGAQGLETGRLEVVDVPGPLRPVPDQPCLGQHLEVLRHRRPT